MSWFIIPVLKAVNYGWLSNGNRFLWFLDSLQVRNLLRSTLGGPSAKSSTTLWESLLGGMEELVLERVREIKSDI